MTSLPRISISLPPDVETGIAKLRGIPRFSRMPMSQVCLFLIRVGMKQKQEWTRFYEEETEGGK